MISVLWGRVEDKTGRPKPPRPSRYRSVLGGLELAGGHLAATLVALELEGDLLAFVERSEARAFHGRDVDENVRAAVVRLDEAEALGGVKPLHGADGHGVVFQV